ncbi:MAG: VpsF family polysaccharide biosynthesis protein [Rhodospirillales bacterium]|nr:VpsF family polysaccharide biosynthesis protein [Rhodospirillales bacterium]
MKSPLRHLAPRWPTARSTPASPWAFRLGLAAVIAHFLVSVNLMYMVGIDYNAPGGNIFVKLHPGTFFALAGATLVLFGGRHAEGLRRLYAERPGLATFLTLMPILAVFSVISVGFSGVAVYIESYIAPGLLLVALTAGTPKQRRLLAYVVLGFALLNVAISVGESLNQAHMIPLQIGDADMEKLQAQADVDEFRGAALYDHPLTGAMVTAIALFMLLGMQLPGLVSGIAFAVLLIGLFSFGGRAAMGMSVVMLAVCTAATLARGLVTRRLSGGFIAAIVAGLLFLPPLVAFVLTSTDIGARLVSHLYYDDSAAVRHQQWEVLDHTNFRDMMFGVSPDRMMELKAEIGLDAATTDIENFWLIMFLNLGVIGFGLYLIAFFAFMIHLGRSTKHPLGWVVLVTMIIVASTSNSLGRKCSDLDFLVACMVGLSGFAGVWRTVPARLRPRLAFASPLRRPSSIGAEPAANHAFGLGKPSRRSSMTLAGLSQP